VAFQKIALESSAVLIHFDGWQTMVRFIKKWTFGFCKRSETSTSAPLLWDFRALLQTFLDRDFVFDRKPQS